MGKGFERDPPPGKTRRTPKGQRTKLTEDRANRIFELLKKGNFIHSTAHMVGVHPQTIHSWMAAGARLEEQERDDYTAHEEMLIWFTWEARAALAAPQVSVIDRLVDAMIPGSPGAVQAITWFLERRYPEQFGRRQVVLTGTSDELRNDFNLDNLSDDELVQLKELMERANEESETGE